MPSCPLCRRAATRSILGEAAWLDGAVIARLQREHPRWQTSDGACPACIQDAVLETLVLAGRDVIDGQVQRVWPLDARAAFGALPTPLRLRADPRFTGRGTTIAFVDAGFFPHPDLVRPDNRIAAWVDASQDVLSEREFAADDIPSWPFAPEGGQWHGLMTSVTAAGNGWLSHGLYRGMASDSRMVLVQVSDGGRITNQAIARALDWLRRNARRFELTVVSLSVGGDCSADAPTIEAAIAALVHSGVVVVAAAGNDGRRALAPPATAATAITVGGLDDRNVLDTQAWTLWHSNYGRAIDRTPKPEVVAPSIWTVAPILPASAVATEARQLFARRHDGPTSDDLERRIGELRLVTPHYQHVEGTSFAAPIVASIAACMRQANPSLLPRRIKELLMLSALRIAGVPDERQGAGAVDAGLAVAAALADARPQSFVDCTPRVDRHVVRFVFDDHAAQSVALHGSWNGWRDALPAERLPYGTWQMALPRPKAGRYSYKFLVDDSLWLPDPSNPLRTVDDEGNVNSVLVAD